MRILVSTRSCGPNLAAKVAQPSRRGQLALARPPRSDALEDAGPLLDRVLLPGGEADRELLIAGGGEPGHALHQLVGRARAGQVADERGGEKALFLRAGPDEVSLVQREVARVRGLVAI